jgi:peptide/nickel transport system permease protein
MSTEVQIAPGMPVAEPAPSRLRRGAGLGWDILRSPAGIVLGVMVLVAVLAPLLGLDDPLTPYSSHRLEPPSWAHPFGTDPRGLDVFSRVIYATRTDLSVAVASVLIGVVIGAPLGALAGYRGGLADGSLMRLSEILQAFPPILLALLVFAAAGNTIPTMIVLIGVFNVPVYVKLVRSVAQPLRDADFVLAARASGHSTGSLVLRHVMPNTLVPVLSQFAISCGFAIQVIAGLSFIGLGVQVPKPEWGSMINVGADQIVNGKWWPSVFPGLAALLAAAALMSLGHRMRRGLLREAA